MTRPITALVCAASLLAGSALADHSRFDTLSLTVTPISAAQFEVIEARGAGARDIWCAASRYAADRLGASRGRLYVATPRGPARTAPGRTGVIFTTAAPTGAAPTGLSVTVRRAGASLPINHAIQFCRDHIIEPADRL
ncbi:MAG: hypothetical protein AAF218_00490 [Pseudomonadota bacterium]